MKEKLSPYAHGQKKFLSFKNMNCIFFFITKVVHIHDGSFREKNRQKYKNHS